MIRFSLKRAKSHVYIVQVLWAFGKEKCAVKSFKPKKILMFPIASVYTKKSGFGSFGSLKDQGGTDEGEAGDVGDGAGDDEEESADGGHDADDRVHG